MRRRGSVAVLWPLVALWPGVAGAEITGAAYGLASDIYDHGALPGGEWAGITFFLSGDREIGAALFDAVYEDTAPRLVDLDGDGAPEVVTVKSTFTDGAAIRIWGTIPAPQGTGQEVMAVLAETAPIGQRHRWLAIAAVADLDGDGRIEIAYVDRPHLARILRVVEVRTGPGQWSLVEEASAEGHTNHHFGSPVIEGGLLSCDRPEVVTASADWTRILATRLEGGALVSRDLGPYEGAGSMAAALDCG